MIEYVIEITTKLLRGICFSRGGCVCYILCSICIHDCVVICVPSIVADAVDPDCFAVVAPTVVGSIAVVAVVPHLSLSSTSCHSWTMVPIPVQLVVVAAVGTSYQYRASFVVVVAVPVLLSERYSSVIAMASLVAVVAASSGAFAAAQPGVGRYSTPASVGVVAVAVVVEDARVALAVAAAFVGVVVANFVATITTLNHSPPERS